MDPEPTQAPPRKLVSVYGSSMVERGEAVYADARRLGGALGAAGVAVATGGYGGVMEAASRGAVDAGSEAVGYTVDGWDMRSPNPYLSREVVCADLYERLSQLIEDTSALLAMGGGIGTLAEVALAWNHLAMKLIAPRPLIVVGPDWARTLESLSSLLEIREKQLTEIACVRDVDEAVEKLTEAGIL